MIHCPRLSDGKEIVFYISLESLQQEAFGKIGRFLSAEEIDTARKCIDFGLLTGIDIVLDTAIDAAVENNSIS